MTFITPEHHPDWVATLTATPDTIVEAANKAFELIHMPQYRAVCLFLKTDTRARSIDIAKVTRNIVSPAADFKLIGNAIIDTDNDKEITLNGVAKIYGPDFATMANFSRSIGPTNMTVRSFDERNNTPHLDRSYAATGLIENIQHILPNTRAPEFGLTATMAIQGNGSDIITIRPNELSRTQDEDWDEKEIWEWEPHSPVKDRTLHTKPNTIILMRSNGWDKKHWPCPHKSADRKDDGNPEERMIGVSFIGSREPSSP